MLPKFKRKQINHVFSEMGQIFSFQPEVPRRITIENPARLKNTKPCSTENPKDMKSKSDNTTRSKHDQTEFNFSEDEDKDSLRQIPELRNLNPRMFGKDEFNKVYGDIERNLNIMEDIEAAYDMKSPCNKIKDALKACLLSNGDKPLVCRVEVENFVDCFLKFKLKQ